MSYVYVVVCRQVIPTAQAIEKLLASEPNAPIVVFVWFRDSARALVAALADRRIRHRHCKRETTVEETRSIVSSSSSSVFDDHECGEHGDESVARIKCEVISGDIVHQSVRHTLLQYWQ
jgi:hypothetical protein